MRGSLTLARVAGIRIAVHWTFLLLVAFVVYLAVQQQAGEEGRTLLFGALEAVAFLVALFVCIVLHELGHALTAKRFGIETQDITLLPIGGMARLQRMPEHPTQELLVAIGGPVVTAVLAIVFLVLTLVFGGAADLNPLQFRLVGGNFVAKLAWVNGVLLGFNLLPAFPMDGGRVLRAILHYEMDYARATRIAATVGQALAFAFGILGLFSLNIILIIIAFFVYLGAASEAKMAEQRIFTRGVHVHDVMVTNFRALSPKDTLGSVIDLLMAGEQQDFPVVENGNVVGVLTRDGLMRGLADRGREAPVDQFMREKCEPAEEDEPLDNVFQRMRMNECSTLPVMRDSELVGMLTLENVGEWIMIQSALRAGKARREVANIYRES